MAYADAGCHLCHASNIYWTIGTDCRAQYCLQNGNVNLLAPAQKARGGAVVLLQRAGRKTSTQRQEDRRSPEFGPSPSAQGFLGIFHGGLAMKMTNRLLLGTAAGLMAASGAQA